MVLAAAIGLASVTLGAQARDPDAQALARQAERRIRELQAESDRLAKQTATLLGQLRALEVEREIAVQRVAWADAELASVSETLAENVRRLAALETQRLAETPGVRDRLAAIYKRGRGGYARLLLAADDIREIGRLSRGVAAVARLDRLRLEAHRRTIRDQRQAVAELDDRQQAVARAQGEAVTARAAMDRAVAAHNHRLDALDRERDLAARYVGELQAAHDGLQARVDALSHAPATLPLAPFRGSLAWPAVGRIAARFGRTAAGYGATSIASNGIEIAIAMGRPARAVHGGLVAFAAPFPGFATLVIVDHGGSAFSLYGHLAEAVVQQGQRVHAGTIVGRTGRSPAGAEALYFELRIDGRPVDPVQWLRSTR